jgi:ATP-dependent DNA helicase RecG
MDISDKTLRDVSEAVSNRIEPKIYPEINAVYLGDTHCIHVRFSGDDAPYYAYGRAYIRVADSDKQMSAAELKSYILKQTVGRNAWDSDVSDKTAADVDETVLSDYIDRANRAGRIDFAYTNNDEVLSRLGVTEKGKLKNAADVLFVGSRMLEVQMAIFAGTERLTFNDINRKSGSVTELIEIAETYIRNFIRWRVVLDGSIQRKEIPEIPMDAVREAIVNSYCHRDFKSSQNNEVVIFKNRVEIYNPGTFPEGLKPEDFIEGDEPSIKRNPLLAQLMYYSKDIESFGTGLKRIASACKEAEVRVEFRMMKRGFAVVFYRPDEHFLETEKMSHVPLDAPLNVTDMASNPYTVRVNVPLNENVPINVPLDVPLNESEKRTLEIISDNPAITAGQIAAILSKSRKTVQRYLSSLQKKNAIKRVGGKKGGHWEVIGE